MRNAPAMIFFLAVGMLANQARYGAHHGNAAYDTTREVTVTGVVTQWMVANPHSILKVDVTDDKGNVVHWRIRHGPSEREHHERFNWGGNFSSESQSAAMV